MEVTITADIMDAVAEGARAFLPQVLVDELTALDTMSAALDNKDQKDAAVQQAQRELGEQYNTLWSSKEGRAAMNIAVSVFLFREQPKMPIGNSDGTRELSKMRGPSN